MFLKKVRMKTISQLKRFARHLGGDMSEDIYYFAKSTGNLIENIDDGYKNFNAVGFHALDHGTEFLVVDHPNPISKQQYEAFRELFTEEDENRSMKGVC